LGDPTSDRAYSQQPDSFEQLRMAERPMPPPPPHTRSTDGPIDDIEGIATALQGNQPSLHLTADLVRQLISAAVQGIVNNVSDGGGGARLADQ
jgi:hypothetical protein